MQILTVTYGRTINLGNYESARLDATVQVEPSEAPEEALDKLKAWIEGQADRLIDAANERQLRPAKEWR